MSDGTLLRTRLREADRAYRHGLRKQASLVHGVLHVGAHRAAEKGIEAERRRKKADMIKLAPPRPPKLAALAALSKAARKEEKSTARKVLPLAAAGAATGLGKGFIEEKITRGVTGKVLKGAVDRSARKRKIDRWLAKNAPNIGRGVGKSLTGAGATVLLGLATMKALDRKNR